MNRVIDIDTLAKNLTAGTPPLDMLVRTSGVNRISDFLLWQLIINSRRYIIQNLSDRSKTQDRERDVTSGAAYYIVPTYWPEFGMWDMIPIIISWQAKELIKRLAEQFGIGYLNDSLQSGCDVVNSTF